MRTETRRVAVIGGNRIPFARANGAYAHASDQDMLTATLDGLVERFGLEGERLGEVVAGAVLKHARDRDLTRESVLGSKLAPETPAYDVQQACGTGLETVIAVANKIALGQIDVGIAGGVDTASDAPIAVNEDLRHILLDLNRAKSLPARARTLTRLRPGQVVPEVPQQRRAADRALDGRARGDHGPRLGRDARRAGRARGGLAREHGRGLRARVLRRPGQARTWGWSATRTCARTRRVEKLAKLKPVFGGEDGTMTAGNSTPLTDGASAVLLASEEWAAERGLPVLAYFVGRADRGRRPRAQARGPADGARVRDAACCSTATGSGSATSTSTRSTRRSPRRCWRRWRPGSDPVFGRERLGRDAPLGEIDRGQAQRQRRLARRRAPVRRDRRADRGLAGEGAATSAAAAAA